jgi:hypothetical protein
MAKRRSSVCVALISIRFIGILLSIFHHMLNTSKRRQNRRIKTMGIAGELAQHRPITTKVISSEAPA